MAKHRKTTKRRSTREVWERRLHHVSAEIQRGKRFTREGHEQLISLAWNLLSREIYDDEKDLRNFWLAIATGRAAALFRRPPFREKPLPPRTVMLREWSSAKFSFAITGLKSFGLSQVLVISFEGKAGKPGAHGTCRFMDAIIAAGRTAWRPRALVLDLRKMRYQWGDEMGETLAEAGGPTRELSVPVAVICSRLNRAGLTSLIRDEIASKPKDMLFGSLDAALAHLDRVLLKERRAFEAKNPGTK